MKQKIKNLYAFFLLSLGTLAVGSCNALLDLQPISQITPESYFETADQLANYLNNYYNDFLRHPGPNDRVMYHPTEYSDGMVKSDDYTDILANTVNGQTTYFADGYYEVPAGKNLQSTYFNRIRVCNFFFEQVLPKYEAGILTGSDVENYIGEMYLMRAIVYYLALVDYGDFPIIETVLTDDSNEIIEASKRAPRNEVARFILSDLDKAIELLYPRSNFSGQRLNREVAYLFKSRVALFEGTFEKYHRGSGRVPGDSNWPGAAMSYNAGKTFDIDSEINFFLNEALEAAKAVADAPNLTENNHVINPPVGTVTGWNPYFEMFSQPSLSSVEEVLLWKEYSASENVKHDAPYRVLVGSADGLTRQFVEGFLRTDGLPIYATASGAPDYDDTWIYKVKEDRDERLQLFVWDEQNLRYSDPDAPSQGALFGNPDIFSAENEKRSITGYQVRKYYTYDYSQTSGDTMLGTNAAPLFRTAEALLNYIEAYIELNGGEPDATAKAYWTLLRERAGITADLSVTINATDLSQEQDLGVYSGSTRLTDPWLYNIRRERMCEMFCEGLRFPDLIRWRSFDRLLTEKWIPEGVNFWDEMWEDYWYDDDGVTELGYVADGSDNSIVSSRDISTYVRPYSRINSATNPLYDGYNWHEAYYLKPLGVGELLYASPDGTKENSYMYQNIYWPTEGGSHALQ